MNCSEGEVNKHRTSAGINLLHIAIFLLGLVNSTQRFIPVEDPKSRGFLINQ